MGFDDCYLLDIAKCRHIPISGWRKGKKIWSSQDSNLIDSTIDIVSTTKVLHYKHQIHFGMCRSTYHSSHSRRWYQHRDSSECRYRPECNYGGQRKRVLGFQLGLIRPGKTFVKVVIEVGKEVILNIRTTPKDARFPKTYKNKPPTSYLVLQPKRSQHYPDFWKINWSSTRHHPTLAAETVLGQEILKQQILNRLRATNINVVPRLYIVIPPNVDIDLSVTTVDKENVIDSTIDIVPTTKVLHHKHRIQFGMCRSTYHSSYSRRWYQHRDSSECRYRPECNYRGQRKRVVVIMVKSWEVKVFLVRVCSCKS
ncbi:hypothetical protein AtEden1_Chr3g0180261 [Arabidopsis thaliana]